MSADFPDLAVVSIYPNRVVLASMSRKATDWLFDKFESKITNRLTVEINPLEADSVSEMAKTDGLIIAKVQSGGPDNPPNPSL